MFPTAALAASAALSISLTQADAPDEFVPLPPPVSDELRSGMPTLDEGADGTLRVAWLELEDERTATLRFSTLEEHGWSAPRTVARGSNWFVNWADVPSLTAHADGTLLAHWLERLGDGTYAYGVRIARSSDDGATWSEPAWLHDDRSPTEHGFASVVALEDGFGALWLDGRAMKPAAEDGGHGGHGTGTMQLRFRTIALDGTLGAERLLDDRTCECCPTALACSPDGRRLFAAWRDRSDDEVRDISFATAEAPFDAWSQPLSVWRDGWELPGCPVNGPRVRADADGAVVAWYTAAGGSSGSVRTRRIATRPDAASMAPPRRWDSGSPEGRVDLALAPDGAFEVLWMEVVETRAAWLLADASAKDDPLVVASVPHSRASGYARVARDPRSGGRIVVWTEPGERRIRAARRPASPR